MTEGERRTLAALADVLIPAGEGMPSASELGVEGKWADRALAARPDVAEDLGRVLREAEGREPAGEVRRLHAEDERGFTALAAIVAGGYTMHAKARKRLGYPGQRQNPALPHEAEYWLDGGLLDPVLARPRRTAPSPNGQDPEAAPRTRS